MPKAGELE